MLSIVSPGCLADQGAVGTELVYTPFKAAAKLLGWNVTSLYPALPTPQDLQQALNQAMVHAVTAVPARR